MDPSASNPGNTPSPTMLDAAIRIGLVALLLYACGRIVLPFAGILAWSAILAVMLYPLHLRLAGWLGNRWSALLIGLVGVAVALGPMVIVVTSLATSIYSLLSSLQNQDLTLPLPPAVARRHPAGRQETDGDLDARRDQPAGGAHQIRPALERARGMAGVVRRRPRHRRARRSFFPSRSPPCSSPMARVPPSSLDACWNVSPAARRAAAQLVTLTAATIRGVALGVVGVALIQSLLLGVGYFAIGLQAAGLLTLAALLLGIVQVPLILLTLPVVVYVFATEATPPAIIFLVWNVVVGLSDNRPQAVDARQGAGSADAGHSDRRHRRHARRWAPRPVRRTCAAGGRAMCCCLNGCGSTRSMAGRRLTGRRNGKPRRQSR